MVEISLGDFDWDDYDQGVSEKINIMKDLPYEMQFDKENLYQTFYNLYHYYKNIDSNFDPCCDLPSPFFEDYILSKIEHELKIEIDDEIFYLELEKYLDKKNKKDN
tara:strand:+ start:110 stop:427 length:318 start_codon:yes stop_codon:yes gene_type:complete